MVVRLRKEVSLLDVYAIATGATPSAGGMGLKLDELADRMFLRPG